MNNPQMIYVARNPIEAAWWDLYQNHPEIVLWILGAGVVAFCALVLYDSFRDFFRK